ncbi:hypothetical protein CGCF415_v005536 [Colletotrichum fructicola]|uniref:Uncharacterized protein n=1 Tax=Colletotrichum fructicola (strain Nara gc5) TaxID=1213859 RepID=A0A7J6JQA9_COLFN|nr:hypothetical protein CGGC5_v000908 [Colletotrichum fructicola Nara gc5]KAF4888852.1 hypothetical protein CGCFRS4_v009642 [Colletotrichum fructicola]KAF4909806.1 hypothetical protein CGCF415_v005536 [Colletotrichum fructicola]KAF4930494.1 hypothetical protein CGCF245_v011668 [Colletotrichum fructicola]KAF5514949.1 hypothetical protein CGCF413_v000878 [Colletotrichum fructicola]
MADHQQVRLSNEAAAAASAAGEGQRQDRGGSNVDNNNNNFNRPSFSDYWQGEKESERAGRVQFVTEGPPPGTSGPSSSAAAVTATSTSSASPQPLEQRRQGSSESATADHAKEKAKLRRQQVRKAQIQHRTRKANYIKQLELDVCKFRDMIAAAEKEVLAYRRDNEGMKGALRARGLRVPEELKGKEKDVVVGEVRIAAAEETPVEEPSYEEVMQQPVEVHPCQPQHSHVPAPPPLQQQQFQQEQTDTQVFSAEEQQMLPEDVSMAQSLDYDPYPPADLFGDVNMGDITVTMSKDATLGTPCFQISSSSTSSLSTPVRPATPDQLSPEQEIIAINLILAMEHICWDHFHPRQYPRHADATKAASGHTMMASTMCMSSAPERVYRSIRRREVETQHTWHASGAGSSLTLRSLLSLAKTLNPGDIELTPVQAWFELAARYGAQALMQEPVIEALKREFCGVVDCIHFGAIIERDAFESVVARVMAEVGVPELPWEGMDVDVGGAGGPGMVVGVPQIAA